MRMVSVAAVAAFVMMAASPALAGDPRDTHPGGGCGGGCSGGGHGGGYGGGGHRPSPPHGGGYNSNINVNVNANANANANAFAGASGGSYFNARTYDVGGIRGGGYGGGTVYVGGGYGGDSGGYYGGGAVYNEEVYEGRTCASAPFGYVVNGFGRNGRRAPACVGRTSVCRDNIDRGGRYGYSERRGCDGGRRERYDGHEESSYERYESYEEHSSWSGGASHETDYGIGDYERGYIDGSRSCDVCRPESRGSSHIEARGTGYGAHHEQSGYEAPVHEAPVYEAPAYEPPVYEVPMTPNQYYGITDAPPPPRQRYRQEPGERG